MSDPLSSPEAGFQLLGLDPRLIETLTSLGYEEPTPIQRRAIPPLLEGRDLVGLAATGTGKTAAFALPLLQRLAEKGKSGPRPFALILVPTRELAMQVAEAVYRYGQGLGVSVLPVYGGQGFEPQVRGLKRGVDVVVATPGRALDHLRRGTLKLDGVGVAVLDEADEMLDMGFAEDLEAILSATPHGRQTMLFSATMPPRITAIARKHLRDPLELRVAAEAVAPGEAPRIRQTAYLVPRSHKLAALGRILDVESPAAALVFCRTRTEVDEVTRTLSARGYRPEALHGGMSQEQRDRVMRLFRAGTADLLIATDVAARGLDVEHLSHVINYHVPEAAESYVHRIGRVGRAGREGVALTLAEGREQRQLRNIERATRQTIHIAPVPSVAELRTRQMQRTRELLRETILGGNLNRQRELLDSLAEEFDVADIALAALELAQRAEGAEEAPSEIPAVEPFGRRDQERGRDRWRDQEAPRKGTVKRRGPAPGMARVYVGIGYEDGIAPRDLVGAIANEVGIPGRDIGAIEITGRFSLVDVPEEAEEDVIEGLRRARVRGRRVMVRPDRDGQRGR